MSPWFKFGQTMHLQTQADPQVAACGSRPLEAQPTTEFAEPPQFACRGCLLGWLEADVVVDEELEDAVGRGYEAAEDA